MAYRAYDVTNLPHRITEIGEACSTLEAATVVAIDHLKQVFGTRSFALISERDEVEDGMDILAYEGHESYQIAINKVI